MHHKHLELGAYMVESDGWQRPARYTSAEREIEHARAAVGIGDISPVGKFSLHGDEIDSVIGAGLTHIDLPGVGGVRQYPASSSGRAPEAVTLLRLAQDEIMALTHPGLPLPASLALGGNSDSCAHVVDLTSGLAGVRVIGPLAEQLLTRVAEIDVADDAFPDKRCAQINGAEIHNVLLRLDQNGLRSYELYFGREFGEYMWDALLEVGEDCGLRPIGIEALGRLQDE